MTIIRAEYVMPMNGSSEIIRNGAVAFEERIKAVGPVDVVRDTYPDAEYIDAGADTVLLPGLINPHVHLEFSANTTTLSYGDFIGWLKSVIVHRDALSAACREICMKKVLDRMIASGTTTIGAISSFGFDLKPCVFTPMNVVYFNEVLGSNPAMVDALYTNFLDRLSDSEAYRRQSFTPAISVHSPYSTHPILAKKAIELAKEKDMVVSTHFMESRAEREWLDRGEGDFVAFFEDFMPGAKPVNEPLAYLKLFEGVQTLFTHAVHASDEELALMEQLGYITHCPVSNRLLQNGRLPIEKIKMHEKLTIGTDGLSSNYSLNLWEEMRAALMMHTHAPLYQLASRLLRAATSNAAKALGTNSGELVPFKDADMIVVKLPGSVEDKEALALQLILHTQKADMVYIGGLLQA
jgi:cytosine/adenosine deaminase-related metal-dependent hydrolase